MGRTDNYPDDIRCYDDDPRSPFYEDPQSALDDWGENRMEQAEGECPAFFEQCARLGLTVTYEVEAPSDHDADPELSVTLKGHHWYGTPEDLDHYAEAFAPLDREHPELKDQIEATML